MMIYFLFKFKIYYLLFQTNHPVVNIGNMFEVQNYNKTQNYTINCVTCVNDIQLDLETIQKTKLHKINNNMQQTTDLVTTEHKSLCDYIYNSSL